MGVDLTLTAIRRDRFTAVVLVFAIAGGLAAYQSLPRAQDPTVTVREAGVVTLLPGASPERVELLITDPIEAAIQEIPAIDYVTSRSRTGVSVVAVRVRDEYVDMRPIWDTLRRKVGAVAPELPDGVIGPRVDDEFDGIFGIIVTVTGEGYSYAEVGDVADAVRDHLLRMDGVAQVDVLGAQAERIFVDYEPARLAELGLSPLQFRALLESVNAVVPGGEIHTDVERIALDPSGDFESLDDLRRTVVTLPGRSDLVALQDLASISRGYQDPPADRVYSSGMPALALAIMMRDGGDVIALGDRVRSELVGLQADYPIGIEFDIVWFQPQEVDTQVSTFIDNLLLAVGIVVGVLLLFMGLRSGLVVASLVPVTIVVALLVMSVFGIGIDQVSLAALTIALGMLVDNAIVMTESIVVQMGVGWRPTSAAVNSARELRMPLLVASLTTAAAFLPIFLAQSRTGEYTSALFTVVAITLLTSWILALTMTPLLCVRFLAPGRARDGGVDGAELSEAADFLALERAEITAAGEVYDGRFYRVYRTVLLAGLRHRVVALGVLVVVFLGALYAFRFVPVSFFPPSNQATFTAEYELPAGTSVYRTMDVVEEIDRFVAGELRADGPESPGVSNWITFVGSGGPRFYVSHSPELSSEEYAFAILNATSRTAITEVLIPRLEAFCRERFPDLRVTLRTLQVAGPFEAPVEVRLAGRNQETLFEAVADVKARLLAVPGVRNVTDDWGARSKKLAIDVDQSRARLAGVTNQDVAISLRTALSGLEATQYRAEGAVIPVTLRSTTGGGGPDPTALDGLMVHAQATGDAVPLLQVADPEMVWEPSTLRRRNRVRTVTVSSEVAPGVTPAEVVAQLRPWLDEQQAGWPPGIHYEIGGEVEMSVASNWSIIEKLPIGALIITLLLVGQFNSIRRAAIILLTIPLGLIGVVAGLLITGLPFGFMALLGTISLAGIVVNNAIVIIDRIGIESDRYGLDPRRALVGAAQRRFRPILLTTVTTVAGLVPLWVGGGPLWAPMVVPIIFGLLFAGVLTLGAVPILYAAFFRVRFDGFRY